MTSIMSDGMALVIERRMSAKGRAENARLRNVIWEAFYELRDGADANAFAILKAEMDKATPKEQADT